ncbi:MAG: SpoIID/LytB domain-containing protein [Peptococcaceae bacterium]|nr:SpoIID/LytB domain-containing protein [Peptococcaceae bacterium]
MQRISLACLAVLVLLFMFPCAAGAALDVKVGLVWQLKGEALLGFEVEQGTYRLSIDDKRNTTVSTGVMYKAGSDAWGMVVFAQGQPIGFCRSIKFEPVQGKLPLFKIYSSQGTKVYRGSLELTRQVDGSLLAVNTLGEQEYLFGVVPMEMSNAWASKGMEALKAQAIAARTYLYTHYDAQQTKGYNISDSPNIDQAYAGYEVEGVAGKAVEATAGEVLVDKSTHKPINASYSSHSGGHTEDSENVWGGVDSHLRGVPDPYSLGVGSMADNWSYTASAIALGKPLGLGPIVDIKLQKFPSGRVRTVWLKDVTGKTVTTSGRRFVALYYPQGRNITTRDFLGSLFSVRRLAEGSNILQNPQPLDIFRQRQVKARGPQLNRIDTSVSPPLAVPSPYSVYVFSGSGWGHGVGMSQWGAYGMAQQGFNYRAILAHYYADIQVLNYHLQQ